MREIKFRGWNSREKKMYVNVLPLSDGTFLLESSKYPYVIVPEWIDTIAPSELFIMEFTGLRDENGVDIFEGDILKAPGCCDEGLHEVYKPGDPYTGFHIRMRDRHQTGLVGFTRGTYALEVVGNICQNSELL